MILCPRCWKELRHEMTRTDTPIMRPGEPQPKCEVCGQPGAYHAINKDKVSGDPTGSTKVPKVAGGE